MSENSISSDFKFEVRKVRINKDDYKDNKKEKFLFEYLSKDGSFFAKLDTEEGTPGVITQNDINIFLSSKEVQKKKITQEDVINFLNKVKTLNPTEKEKVYSNMNFVDENNQRVITEDMYEYFDDKKVYSFDFKKDIIDSDGNIKKGFEIFDLNGDNKFDDLEYKYFSENSAGKQGYKELQSYLSALDRTNPSGTSGDNKITTEDRQNVYRQLQAEYTNELLTKLKNITIKGPFDKKVVTPEIINMFNNGKSEIKFEDMLDSTGHLKPGFEVFDLNGDFKIDDNEKAFFSSGGHPLSDDSSKLTLENLIKSLEVFDKFGYDKRYGYNKTDEKILSTDKVGLYKMLEASHYMLDTIKTFPEDIQKQYEKALHEVNLGDYKSLTAIGISKESTVSANFQITNKDELASVLIHELTHYILSKNGMKSALLQEVETFFMEYQLYTSAKNNPDYMKDKAIINDSIFTNNIIDYKYLNYIDDQKRKNPDISDKELAVEAFLKFHYDFYNTSYNEGISQDELREIVKNADNFIFLK